MRGVGLAARVERGDVALEDLERCGRVVGDVAPFAVRCGFHRQVVPLEHGGTDLGPGRLWFCVSLGHGGQGGENGTQHKGDEGGAVARWES